MTALVTGAGRGIGLAIAKALARAKIPVALNGPLDDEELDNAVAEVQSIGPAIKLVGDVSDLSTHNPMLDLAESLGPLTTLINNAGVGVQTRGDILDVSPDSFDRCMAVNARAVFFLTQAFAKRLVGTKSEAFRSIVTITSANAEAVATARAEYTASKAAAAMITKNFAVRLGAEGIHVYDVRPGLIETDMTAPVIADYKRRAEDGLTVIPRVGQPEEVANIVTSLVTSALPYTTGQVISADGGMLIPRF